MNVQQLTAKHNLVNDLVFRFKTLGLTAKRFFENTLSPLRKYQDREELINQPVIAFSKSDLWNPFDNKDNWILTAGKIENLRIAARKLNGLEIKANEVFSFWRHIGNPNFGQGYVIGREIREGCIVPTIAGGLCQLSNALYDAALKANFDIIERHKHTKVVKGSLAEQDRDATVKWNYVDLRFKSNFDFRIEVELSADQLILQFKSQQRNIKLGDNQFNFRQSNKLNDCYSCGNLACFKHPDRSGVKQEIANTTFILDQKWPEFDNYIKSIASDSDYCIVPVKENRFIKTTRYTWNAMNSEQTRSTTFQGLYRAIKLRLASKNKNNVFELGLALDKKIAQAAAKQIPFDSSHLLISQNLLPFIYETGVLGGRTFDVLMTRLPIEKLQERLDAAFANHPASPTLKDFRASKELIELENKALTKARKIITTHSEIAETFKNKVVKLDWQIPTVRTEPVKENLANKTKVLFPASALGRKGAYEIKSLARELNLNVTIAGKAIEQDNFWEELNIEQFDGNFNEIGLVVYPTYVESQPRQILNAIAKGIPVITTTACGLDPSDKVKVVSVGDFEALKKEVQICAMDRAKDESAAQTKHCKDTRQNLAGVGRVAKK